MKEFGRQAYADTVYINFDSNSRMAELFASDLDTERLIMGLELYVGRKIDPDNSLLIFDEVQEVPRALSSLKYFFKLVKTHCLQRYLPFLAVLCHIIICSCGRYANIYTFFRTFGIFIHRIVRIGPYMFL